MGERISPRLIEALEDKLYLWGSVALDLGGVNGSSVLCSIEVHAAHSASRLRQKQRTALASASRGNRNSSLGISDEVAAPVERAMAAIKRENPKLYEVLKVEARATAARRPGRTKGARPLSAHQSAHLSIPPAQGADLSRWFVVWAGYRNAKHQYSREGEPVSRKANERGEFLCTGCYQWKAPEEFPRNNSPFSRCGRASRCKSCRAAYRRAYRARQARQSNITALIQRRTHQFF
ncbi:hypothetical protein [Microbulbifer sp. PSTR4-B]|uniref:hypothetical protein n=1 Tax=Microbulbifer sp. PSTR4-B TaxID=3243396 RepID=UPI004039838B